MMNGEIIIAIEETENGTFVVDGKGTVISYDRNYGNNGEVYLIPAKVGGVTATAIADNIFLKICEVRIDRFNKN